MDLYVPGETRAGSNKLCSPFQTSSCPSSSNARDNWSQYSTQQESSTTKSGCLLQIRHSQPWGKTSLCSHSDSKRATLSLLVHGYGATALAQVVIATNYALAPAEMSCSAAPVKPTNFLSINPGPPILHGLQLSLPVGCSSCQKPQHQPFHLRNPTCLRAVELNNIAHRFLTPPVVLPWHPFGMDPQDRSPWSGRATTACEW